MSRPTETSRRAAPGDGLRLVAVVQARMSSTRLPGKVLMPLLGRSVLAWVLRAAAAADGVDEVVVATSTDPSDDVLAAEAGRLGARVHRGPLDDVLSRFAGAIDGDTDAVLRLTADCPLLDPAVIGLLARVWRAAPHVDHLSTTNPRCLPRGLDAEVVSRRALDDVLATAVGADRVHVTSAVYRQPDRFEIAGLCLHPSAADLRVTLDTPDDLVLLQALTSVLGDRPPRWTEVVSTLRARPDLVALNRHVRQKELAEG